MTAPAPPDVLAAIVAATRRRLDVRRAQGRRRRVRAAAERRAAGRRALRRRSSRAPAIGQRDRRVQAPVAEPRRAARRLRRAARSRPATKRTGRPPISVLTEPTFFDGSLDDLRAVRARVRLPLLRKDFVIDEHAAVRGAGGRRRRGAADRGGARAGRRSAACTPAAAELGLAVLVEVHDATNSTSRCRRRRGVIGVNNRNLRTLAVDPAASLDLVDGHPGRRGGRRGERAAAPRRPAAPARRRATTRSWSASGWSPRPTPAAP